MWNQSGSASRRCIAQCSSLHALARHAEEDSFRNIGRSEWDSPMFLSSIWSKNSESQALMSSVLGRYGDQYSHR